METNIKSTKQLVAVAIIGCAVAQRADKAINYEIPSGNFRYINQYDTQRFAEIRPQPQVRYIQPQQAVVRPQSVIRTQEPLVRSPPVNILSMRSDSSFDGNFRYDFASENGIQSTASGIVKPIPGAESPAQTISGSYSYTAPDGTPITTNWYADETGFHAEGSHIPVAPPVPAEIQRSLEYLRTLPPNPEDHKWD